jgi:hypothetical protein
VVHVVRSRLNAVMSGILALQLTSDLPDYAPLSDSFLSPPLFRPASSGWRACLCEGACNCEPLHSHVLQRCFFFGGGFVFCLQHHSGLLSR